MTDRKNRAITVPAKVEVRVIEEAVCICSFKSFHFNLCMFLSGIHEPLL